MASNEKKFSQFSSQELEAAFARVDESLRGREARLDGISNDIKLAEKTLAESNFACETWSVIGIRAEGSVSPLDQVEEALGWAEHQGRYRVMFRKRRWEGAWDVDDGIVFISPDEQVPQYETEICKPLIETPVEIREKLHEELPKFILELGAKANPALRRELEREASDAIPF